MVMGRLTTPTVALFVPGNRPDRFDKALDSGADAVIIDLEDAVADEHKQSARAQVAKFVRRHPQVIVRVNARATTWFDEDLAALSTTSVAAVMLPKAESADDVAAVRSRLRATTRVLPLIESAWGLRNLEQILACEGVWCAGFGSIDFALDLACAHSWDALLLARAQLVLHSKLAGLPPPIDGVTAAFDQPELVEHEARQAAQLGFGGKLAIHPRQLAPIRKGFQPDAATLAWAQAVIAASETGGAAQIDGAMVDRPVIERAKRVLVQAQRTANENCPVSSTDADGC